MLISEPGIVPTCQRKHGTVTVKQVLPFHYLRVFFISDSRCKKEIHWRINLAKAGYKKMKRIFNYSKLCLYINIRLLKTIRGCTLMYGCESWTINHTAESHKNIATAEIWFRSTIMGGHLRLEPMAKHSSPNAVTASTHGKRSKPIAIGAH